MTRFRPKRSNVRHGMASCARYGCTRQECRRAYRRAHKSGENDRARGITGRVDAAPAARRIKMLLLSGMSVGDISNRSGVSATSIRAISRGSCRRIYRTTGDAVLGIPLPRTPVTPVGRSFISAVGSQRRLQALSALGWTRDAVSTRIGLSPRTIGDIRRGVQPRVEIAHHQAIVRVYEELWKRRPDAEEVSAGAANRLRAFAKRQGWLLPAELDDDEIDMEIAS